MRDVLDVTVAELAKAAKRPALWVLLAVAIVLSQVFNYLIPYLAFRSGDTPPVGGTASDLLPAMLPDHAVGSTISGFPVFAGALALVFGALITGSEFGWDTVKTQLIQRPGRIAVLAGQWLAMVVGVLVGVAAMLAFSAVSSTVIAAIEGASLAWGSAGDVTRGVAAGALILLMWAGLGAALGVVLRGVAMPIGLGVVWVLGVENLVAVMASTAFTALQPVRDVLPGVNAGSLVASVAGAATEGTPGVTDSVDGIRAVTTVCCYLAVAVIAAMVAMRRRDVT